MQAKNQNSIKDAKIFGRPMARYNVGHAECRKIETFESDNWVVDHHCYLIYGISKMWIFFVQQFNVKKNVGQMSGKSDKWLGS